MGKFQGIIFDLDGTLIDSVCDIADAMNRTLQQYGFPVHPEEAYKHFVGRGLRNLTIQCLPEENRDEETIEICFRSMTKDYLENYLNKTKLYDGIGDLLDTLSAGKMKMAVLSNKADEITQKIAKDLLQNWHFEIILGFTDHFPRKPAPDSALFIAKKLDLQPKNILYLGDTGIDMETANAAGMFPVGVSWGFRKREELELHGAKKIIDKPMELVACGMDKK